MDYPKFKYIEDCHDILEYNKEGVQCQCCGKITNFYTEHIYCVEDIDVICDECIKSGFACKKFNGSFNEARKIDNIDAFNEIVHKTPRIPAFQEFIWPDCCNDMCKYLRLVRLATDKDLEDPAIIESLKETWKNQYITLDDLVKFHWADILLFQCTHCGKYYANLDQD